MDPPAGSGLTANWQDLPPGLLTTDSSGISNATGMSNSLSVIVQFIGRPYVKAT